MFIAGIWGDIWSPFHPKTFCDSIWRPRNNNNKKLKQTNKQTSETPLSLSYFWQAFSKRLCQSILRKPYYHFLQNSLQGAFTGRGWGEDTSHPWQGLWEVILVLLAQSLGSLTALIWQRAPRLLMRCSGSSAERTRPFLTAASLPSTLHSLPKQKGKGENPQIRLTVELSLPFLRTAAKLTHRWFFLASLFFDDAFSMLSIKLKYCLPGISAHQVLYYRWN